MSARVQSPLLRDRISQAVFAAIFEPRKHHVRSSPAAATPAASFPGPPRDKHSESLDRERAARAILKKWASSPECSYSRADVYDLIDHLSYPDNDPRLDKDIRTALGHELETHLAREVVPQLRAAWKQPHGAFERLIQVLEPARRTHFQAIDDWLADAKNAFDNIALDDNAPPDQMTRLQFQRQLVVHKYRRILLNRFRQIIGQDIPQQQYAAGLLSIFKEALHVLTKSSFERSTMDLDPHLVLLRDLSSVDLLGDSSQRILASAVQQTIDAYVHSFPMRVDWFGQSRRTDELRTWVSQSLEPAVEACLRIIVGHQTSGLLESDREEWQRMALEKLGRARLDNLLSYVQMWPRSLAAILDLKEYMTLPVAKMHIAWEFGKQMEDRIRHASITTAELLAVYVAVIRVFKTLDNRSVLLEKVAQPLRGWLRERDDTVKVIAVSFLAQLDENNNLLPGTANADEVCIDITREVLSSEATSAEQTKSLDWDDMSWLPDPIDAGPDYRSSKSNDVLSYMLTLFDHETFIKETCNILGERLLRSDDPLLQSEIGLVEKLKSRLGADKLQAAEVMVRDMADSARMNKLVASHRSKVPTAKRVHDAIPEQGIAFPDLLAALDLGLQTQPATKARIVAAIKEAAVPGPGAQSGLLFRNPAFAAEAAAAAAAAAADDLRLEVKVLSSFFWPELRDDEFRIPAAVRAAQAEFEAGFRRIRAQRGLRWLGALGRADVEVQLEDRAVRVEGVKTWVAAVIHAFEGGEGRRSAAELEEELNMDEALVRHALAFWVQQRVLREVADGVFATLERLADDEEGVPEQEARVREVEAVSAIKTQDAVLKANKALYEMFIVGMLTNGGAMDAGRVGMMLKMVVPGGFDHGHEELLWLLGGMEQEGKVEQRGDAWTIKK